MTDTKLNENKKTINVTACLIGERINTRLLEQTPPPVAVSPLTIRAGKDGYAVIFRYGPVVMFGLSEEEMEMFLSSLYPLVKTPYENIEFEQSEINIDPEQEEGLTSNGVINVKSFTIEIAQMISEVLSDAILLSFYENKLTQVFDNIEPLAEHLKKEGKCGAHGKDLTKHIGDILLTLIKTVGKVGISDRPDVLWDFPYLERLYTKLVDEYELRERNEALNKKLDLASRTIETLLNLDQHKHSSRLEWYVIILIIIEIYVMMIPLIH